MSAIERCNTIRNSSGNMVDRDIQDNNNNNYHRSSSDRADFCLLQKLRSSQGQNINLRFQTDLRKNGDIHHWTINSLQH